MMALSLIAVQDLIDKLQPIMVNEPFQVWQLYGDDEHRVGCGYETDWLVNGGFAERLYPTTQAKMFILKLTVEGVRLRRYRSASKYEKMEIRKLRAEDRGNFCKVYWLYIAVVNFVVGAILGVGVGEYLGKHKPDQIQTQQQKMIPPQEKTQPTKAVVK